MKETGEKKPGIMSRLQERWQLPSMKDTIVVLIVFAMTGTTIVLIKPFILESLIGSTSLSGWYSVAYYVLILPIYNLFLLVYGALLGKFKFFWDFEKRMIQRIFQKKG